MTNNVSFFRSRLHLTQDELAHACGITRQSLSSIERCEYLPSLRHAFSLANFLGVPVSVLFDFSDEMTIHNVVVPLEDLL